MKCPKCGKKLDRVVDKKYPAVIWGHLYPLSFNIDYSELCSYNKVKEAR